MKFTDEGIIISIKKYGENSALVKIFSKDHGIFSAFVKSIKSSKDRVIFQIGNFISFEYRSRIEENLGQLYYVDLLKSHLSKIIFEKTKIDCVTSLFSIINNNFLERENQDHLFKKLDEFLQNITSENCTISAAISTYIKLELKILESLGYGVDLSSCVVTNSTTNLAFVSPKSARAVSFEIGIPHQNKLLKLPNFLISNDAEYSPDCLRNGLHLSGFFLEKFLNEENKKDFSHRKHIKQALEAL